MRFFLGTPSSSRLYLVAFVASLTLLTGCAVPDDNRSASQQVRLIAHDSFVVTDEAVEKLQRETGIELVVLTAGDAGSLVGNALLKKGDIGADVLFGVDNILLDKVLAAGVFTPHGVETGSLLPEFAEQTAGGLVMPIDYGDVCINIDRTWYKAKGIPEPKQLADFVAPQYKGQLVVPDPASSSPGLAFLLATVAEFGEAGSAAFWKSLSANDVLLTGDWTQAYVGNFTAGGGQGSRPAVVSYATSPPAEIIYASEPKPRAPKSVALTDGCYRQVEFAGVLSGAANPAGASRVIEWLVSESVQEKVAETMFVLPVRQGIKLPAVFEQFAAIVDTPLALDPSQITEGREEWINQWSKAMNS